MSNEKKIILNIYDKAYTINNIYIIENNMKLKFRFKECYYVDTL
jgi:hypothetical protein